jgi:hypothetical protein
MRRSHLILCAAATSLLLALLTIEPWSRARPEPSPARATAATPAPEPLAPPTSSWERAADGMPIMPHSPVDTAAFGPMHPHPHTPTHDRIYRENNLVGQLNGSMDRGDIVGLRLLLEQYRQDFPEDAHRLQEGYALIADCLEGTTDETRARATRYWKERRGSTLRRYVRRHCLPPS